MTIFALASGGGRSGIAVVRVSGRRSAAVIEALSGKKPPTPRFAKAATFRNPRDGEIIDRGILLWFPAPRSYTGEDVAEFQIHGGPAVVAALVAALSGVDGLRPAVPGEFTRRAFENGKLDLTQVEGLADLVAAETEAQRRQSQRQLDGVLGDLYDSWREKLIRALAHLEAYIDFPEEEIPGDTMNGMRSGMENIVTEIRQHIDDNHRGERLRNGFYVAIIGAPNVGKSSLLNRLSRREAAIVSGTAGTTRDVIEVSLDIGGYPVTLADTAGLRDSGDELEAEGVRRAEARARAADLKLAMFSASELDSPGVQMSAIIDEDTLVVANKCDLAPVGDAMKIAGHEVLSVSALSGTNIDALMERLVDEIAKRYAPSSAPAITRDRHRAALIECLDAIGRALNELDAGHAAELAAEDLRLAIRAMGRITGTVDIEDILDVVFKDFCIGK